MWSNGGWEGKSMRSGYKGPVLFCTGISFYSLCDNQILNTFMRAWLNQACILGPKDEKSKHRHWAPLWSTRNTSNKGII